jgi:hypothetical protein
VGGTEGWVAQVAGEKRGDKGQEGESPRARSDAELGVAAVDDRSLPVVVDDRDRAVESRERRLESGARDLRVGLGGRPVADPGARCCIVGTGRTQRALLKRRGSL